MFDNWLSRLWTDSARAVYLFDRNGVVITRGGLTRSFATGFLNADEAPLTFSDDSGETEGVTRDSREATLIGYSRARVPRWLVIVAEPRRSVVSPRSRV